MPFLLLAILGVWLLFGDLGRRMADWFYPNDAAPWENVIGYYYPARQNLTAHVRSPELGGMDACRDWAAAQAMRYGDPGLRRGTYECGVGLIEEFGDMAVFRLTIQ